MVVNQLQLLEDGCWLTVIGGNYLSVDGSRHTWLWLEIVVVNKRILVDSGELIKVMDLS